VDSKGDQMMITRKSPFSGKVNVMDINVTKAQLDSWKKGQKIQDAMPNVSAEEREFIKTGITPLEWAKAFPPEAEDD